MKAVLGLKLDPWHDTGAAVVVERNGELHVSTISQERLDRVKHSRAFPQAAIDYCLQLAGCRLRDVALVVADFIMTPDAFDAYPGVVDPAAEAKRAFFRNLGEMGIPVVFVEHHLCHAASAFFATDWDDAIGLVIDGHGSFYESQSIFACDGRGLTKIATSHRPGTGWMYSAVTEELLGFEHLQEGKTMGLAGWARSDGGLANEFAMDERAGGSHEALYPQFVDYRPDRTWRVAARADLPRRSKGGDPMASPYPEYANAAQTELERGVMKLARYARTLGRQKRLCYSGGVALNILANRLLLDSGLFEEVFIQPAASDAGIPLGAALLGYYTMLGGMVRWRMQHAFLARDYTPEECETAAQRWAGPRAPYDLETFARVLDNDYLAAWCQGASEFGPRALGHRSILCSPRHPRMKAYLNREVKHREMFRPFAPLVPKERQSEFFDLSASSPYMLLNSTVHPEKRELVPAIVHADGTARVQTIERGILAELHALLEALGRTNGVPVLLNTSLNLAGEPIAETPADVVDLFMRSRLDVLVLGTVLLSKQPVAELDAQKNRNLDQLAAE